MCVEVGREHQPCVIFFHGRGGGFTVYRYIECCVSFECVYVTIPDTSPQHTHTITTNRWTPSAARASARGPRPTAKSSAR
jgi:hypothetical protein